MSSYFSKICYNANGSNRPFLTVAYLFRQNSRSNRSEKVKLEERLFFDLFSILTKNQRTSPWLYGCKVKKIDK